MSYVSLLINPGARLSSQCPLDLYDIPKANAVTDFGFVAGGAIFLLMILAKYIRTRMELKAWEVATYIDGRTTWRSFQLEDDTPVSEMPTCHSTGIYDNWLLTRFSVAFVFMV